MISGILYIDKQEGYTSSDIDSLVKRKFNLRKVGHLGTLDPFATGLLVVALGEATKGLSLFDDKEKEYVASLVLGESKDTEDKTGVTMESKEVPELSLEQIQATLNSFLGKSMQRPNPYSARHVNGLRAYQLARAGIEVELPEKEIEVKEIKLLSYVDHTITFSVVVSKGTYIRALGRDIALKLGTVGYLSRLRRTRVGMVSVDMAKPLDETTSADLKNLLEALPYIRVHKVASEREDNLAIHGQKLRLPYEDEFVFVRNETMLLGIYKKADGIYDCFRGMRDEN